MKEKKKYQSITVDQSFIDKIDEEIEKDSEWLSRAAFVKFCVLKELDQRKVK